MNTLTLWGLAAAIPAVICEYLYRTLPGGWFSYLYLWVPSSLFISYAIYRLVTTPKTSLLEAFVVWAFSTALLRIIASLALGDQISVRGWVAFGLVILARVVQNLS